MEKIVTIYTPFVNETNKYCDIVKRAMSKQNIEVLDIHKAFLMPKIKGVEIINFNWLENLINQESIFKCILFYLRNIIVIYWMKANRVKIVATLHNKVPHNCKYFLMVNHFMHFYVNVSDAIVILCDDSFSEIQYLKQKNIRNKIKKIPHPNYITECNQYFKPIIKQNERFKVLFFGAIKPYKNIEIIIDIAKRMQDKKIDFIIAGKPCSEEYEKQIIDRTLNISNVDLKLSFLEDNQLYSLITENDIIIAPYNMESSLNSGTLLLAFSLGRNVICPSIGTVKEFEEKLIYSYTYSDNVDHSNKLIETVCKAYSDYQYNFESFKEKANKLHDVACEKYSEDIIGKQYRKLYEEITQ